MLGFTSTRQVVDGNVAREIRETLSRINNRALSSEDKAKMSMQNCESKYILVEG